MTSKASVTLVRLHLMMQEWIRMGIGGIVERFAHCVFSHVFACYLFCVVRACFALFLHAACFACEGAVEWA